MNERSEIDLMTFQLKLIELIRLHIQNPELEKPDFLQFLQYVITMLKHISGGIPIDWDEHDKK